MFVRWQNPILFSLAFDTSSGLELSFSATLEFTISFLGSFKLPVAVVGSVGAQVNVSNALLRVLPTSPKSKA